MPAKAHSTVKLEPAMRDRVNALAAARNISAHAIMVAAVERYVEREEQRETLRQQALRAHEHFVRTGLHLTHEDILKWANDCRTAGKVVEPPKCHV